MDFSFFLLLFITAIALLLAFFILLRKTSIAGTWFATIIVSVSLWSFTNAMCFIATDIKDGIFWAKLSYLSAILIAFSFFYFSLNFPENISYKKNKKPLLDYIIIALFSLVSIIIIFPGVMVKTVLLDPWEIVNGTGLYFFAAYFFLLMSWSLYNLGRKYFISEGNERMQLKYLFLGCFFSIAFGATFNLILPLLGNYDFVWFGPPSTIIMIGFVSYSILRHRLMDITVATGRVLTYATTFITLFTIGYLLSIAAEYLNLHEVYKIIFIVLVATTLFNSIFNFFEKFASRYLYYSFYSSKEVLNKLGEKLTRIMDVDELSDLTTKTIMETMKLDRTVILLRNEKTGKFDIKRNFGFKEENGISLVKDSFLTEYLKKTQKPLVYDELTAMISDAKSEEERKKIKNLRKNMQKIEAALCNLLISKDEVIGMIVLGEKISKDPYTHQDVELLDSLCKQISISLQNAKLYSEVQDFSENLEKKVDEQVKELKVAYKKLQRLDKIKTEFMSIVSHQLRTPLSIIKGHLSMIEEGVYDNNEERRKEILTNVYKANERLITLVNDVLNISRIQSGKVEIHKEETSIEKIIEETIEKMQKPAEDKGVKITFSKPKEDIPLLNIDTNKIENILINLIDNALKYTPQGEITISLQKEEKDIKIEIKDTGDGMTKEEIEKLFETFSRGEAGKKHWIQGSGLGLYIAKQFVEMHEGKIWATSEGEGKGSQFYITLPF